MNFWPALAGAFVGASAAILVTWIAGRRISRNERIAKILDLAGQVIGTAYMLNQVLRWERPDDGGLFSGTTELPPLGRITRVDNYLVTMSSAYSSLGWFLRESTLYGALLNIEKRRFAMLSAWADEDAWQRESVAFAEAVDDLEEGIEWFANLGKTAQTRFLRSVHLPHPPTIGVRPASWPGVITRWTRFRWWLKDFFIE